VLYGFFGLLLPPKAKTGRPRADDRMVLNGILYVLVTGCRWMDMPVKSALRCRLEVAVDNATVEARKGGDCRL